MKISNIGIILLTALVLLKYFISEDTLSPEDGALSHGLVVDYSAVQKDYIASLEGQADGRLLAYQSSEIITKNERSKADQSAAGIPSLQNSSHVMAFLTEAPEESDEPAPMEYANTLVVYNPHNPAIANMHTQYFDHEDSEPLDQGNTLVNEMQLMMPRR